VQVIGAHAQRRQHFLILYSKKSAHSSNKPLKIRLFRILIQNFKKTQSQRTTEIASISHAFQIFCQIFFSEFLPASPRRCFVKNILFFSIFFYSYLCHRAVAS
jgi:hypothetical protein